MPFNHRNLSRPLLLMPSIFSSSRVFYSKSVLRIRWPKYWRSSISLSNEYSGLIFFRNDWFDLPAVQGTLKSFLQHHSSKKSILRCPTFFTVQFSHPYMATGETIALTKWTFPVSRLFASSRQSTGASASVLPMNIQGGFTLQLTRLISLQSKGFSRVISNTTDEIHQFFSA